MLRWRLLLGVVFVAVLAGLFVVDHRLSPPGIVLVPLVALLSLVASQELLAMMGARGLSPSSGVVYFGNLLIVLAAAVPLWTGKTETVEAWSLAAFAVAGMLAFVAEMRRYRGPGESLERLASGVFAVAYVGIMLSYLAALRGLGGGQWGTAAIISLLVVVKLSDIGAYTIGRLAGRHRLAPNLSPGKTIEGAAGGLVFGIVGAWFSLNVLGPMIVEKSSLPMAMWRWGTFGLLVALAGIVGDLAESLIKRDAGSKDSSTWMPGFGGVLDLLDSVLIASPVAYWCWSCGLVGF